MDEMARLLKWAHIIILSWMCIGVFGVANVTYCLQKWDCKWKNFIPFIRNEGTCSFIREGYYPIDGPSTTGPSGPCNLRVSCERSHGSTPDMFECLTLLAGDAEIKTLLLISCNQLEIEDNDLNYFTSLEEFNISYTSIRKISNRSFYQTNNLVTIDLHQDYFESGIFEYPNALIGPDLLGIDANGTDKSISFLPNLRNLLLHNFLFESGIPQNAFHNHRMLQHLTFSHVTLKNSDFLSMRNLTNLSHLEIYDSPMITMIPLDLSSGLPHLTHLELSWTNITEIQSNSFSSFSFLETLTLSDNHLLEAIDPQTFTNLIRLNRLSLARNPRLEMVPVLHSLSQLRNIDLSFCAISNLSSRLFADNGVIQEIDLSGNKFIDIPNIFANNGFLSLENVEYIGLSKNQIKRIKSYSFSNLQHVKFISLSRNHIQFIARHAFYNLKNILEIQLDFNALTVTGLSQSSFLGINTLRYLDLSSNVLTNFPKFPSGVNWEPVGAYSLPKFPFRTDLKNNPLTCDCDMFKDMFVQRSKNTWELHYYYDIFWPGNFYLSNQRFDNAVLKCIAPTHGGEYQRIDDMLRSPDEFVTVMNSPMDCPTPCTCFIQCDSHLFYTTCSNANLTSVPSPINPQTNVLKLKNNNITKLTSNTFSHLPNLVFLDLSGNNINQIENGVFNHLNFLRIIFLNNSKLTQISPRNLNISSPHFHRLDLSSNFISNLDNDTFESIPSLTRLEISDNNLQSLPIGVLDNFHNLTYLMISGNPFNCSCDILYLTNWYKEKVFDVGDKLKTDIPDIDCAPYLNETALIHWVEEMEIRCSPPPTALPVTSIVIVEEPYQWVILISGVTAAVVLTSIICGMIYKFRLEILVLIYIRTGLKLFGNDNAKEEKEYDAFISFSSFDRDFVLKELLPNLECQGKNRKLCIHHRDFVVGECIVTNIINAIENSSKILILCSKNYVESEWCSYEFKSAHQQALRDKTRRIVFVMMEDVDQKTLDKGIKAYISTNTYLDRKDPLFWYKLDYAIPESKDRSKQLEEGEVRVYPHVDTLYVPHQNETKL